MSAFMVPRAHIATLAAFAFKGRDWPAIGRTLAPNMVQCANTLASTNAISVDYRYPDSEGAEAEAFYTEQDVMSAARADLIRDPVAIIKAAQCLDYQSCEFPEYKGGPADRMLQAIISAAASMLPGYDKADAWPIKAAKRGQS